MKDFGEERKLAEHNFIRRYKHRNCQLWYWFYLIYIHCLGRWDNYIIVNYKLFDDLNYMEMKLQSFIVNG